MTIDKYADAYAGKQIADWDPENGIADPDTTIYRISVYYEEPESWTDKFADFINDPNASKVTGIVAGMWFTDMSRSADDVVEALVAARDKLPALTAIFIGDITYEDCEISWIHQSDVSPLFEAYPSLEHFRVRGGDGLSVGPVHHQHLKSLIIEAGGLDASVVEEVLKSDLPLLEHLELWLGTDGYGATTALEDLAPLLSGNLFPKLRYLGLRDSDLENEIAQAIVRSPLLERIETLDLSLGVLDDQGAAALLNSPAVGKLKKLDIHFHYCSEEMVTQLETKLREAGGELDASDHQRLSPHYDPEWRYVAVGE